MTDTGANRKKTNPNGRRKAPPVTLAAMPTSWDQGPITLPALTGGKVDMAVSELRDRLKHAKAKPRKIFKEDGEFDRMETLEEARDRIAPKVAAQYMTERWGRTEPATDFDPETGREARNPNGIRRRRRESWVHIYGRQGRLTGAQIGAAEKLRMAAEGMRERDPLAAIGEIRHNSGDVAASRVDARRYFRALWDRIPISSRPVVERVVLDDEPIWRGSGKDGHGRHMQRLRVGLDAIA